MVNVYTEQIVAFVNRKEQTEKTHSQTSSRFLSVDPLARQFPFYTPYQFAGNKPIECIDLDGLEDLNYRFIGYNKKGQALISVAISEGSTSNSNGGRFKAHNSKTGVATPRFPYPDLQTIFTSGYIAELPDYNAIKTDGDKGSKNYYFSIPNTLFSDKLLSLGAGSQLDADGNVKFKSGVFAVDPNVAAPTFGTSDQFDITQGITDIQSSLKTRIESVILDQLSTASQTSGDVTEIKFSYDSKLSGAFTDDFKKSIESVYGNAVKVTFSQNPIANDNEARDIINATVETTVTGTPTFEEQ